jgi:hypothetical protein
MPDWRRRAFLASSVAGLSAVAGCASLPVVGNSDDEPSYDYQRLGDAADPDAVPEPSLYPGRVPDALAEAHYERGRSLLDGVPADLSFPNGVVEARLTDQRERAAEDFAAAPDGVSSVGTLGQWRRAREDAAEVRGAYDAASGDLTQADIADRRARVRSDLTSFRSDWSYRGDTVVEAVVVHRQLERLASAARRSLLGRRRLRDDLQSAVFAAGEVVADLEGGRATVADAAGLRDAYVTDGMDAYVDDIATAASRLEDVISATLRNVGPDIDRESDVGDFHRDLEGTPAAELFWVAQRTVVGTPNMVGDTIARGDYATAVASAGHTLVDVVAAGSAVSAIRDGEHGQPASTDEIVELREQAFAAVDDTLPTESGSVEAFVGWPARRALRDAESELGGYEFEDEDRTPDHRDVVRAVGGYAYAVYAADAVPAVVDRVESELGAGE